MSRAGATSVNVHLPGPAAHNLGELARAYGEVADETMARAVQTLADLNQVKGRRRPVRVPLPGGEVLTVWASRSQRRLIRRAVGVALLVVAGVLMWAMW